MRTPILASLLVGLSASAMAIDLAPLWDFGRPDLSEQRFRGALQKATGFEIEGNRMTLRLSGQPPLRLARTR